MEKFRPDAQPANVRTDRKSQQRRLGTLDAERCGGDEVTDESGDEAVRSAASRAEERVERSIVLGSAFTDVKLLSFHLTDHSPKITRSGPVFIYSLK